MRGASYIARPWFLVALLACPAMGVASQSSTQASASQASAPKAIDAPESENSHRFQTQAEVFRTLEATEAEQKRVEKEQVRLRALRSSLEARIIARSRLYIKRHRGGLLAATEGPGALADYAAKAERIRRALQRDIEELKKVDASRLDLAAQHERLSERIQLLEVQGVEAGRSRQAVLAAEEREDAFRRAFESRGTGQAAEAAIYAPGESNAEELDNVKPADEAIAKLKGKLEFPIPGRMEFQHAEPEWAQGRGLIFRASAGSSVRAIADGRVAYAGPYGDYGNALVIDHGDDYFSVSAKLSIVEVKAGDELSVGHAIGVVGQVNKKAGFFFEMRRGRDVLDAAPWFGL